MADGGEKEKVSFLIEEKIGTSRMLKEIRIDNSGDNDLGFWWEVIGEAGRWAIAPPLSPVPSHHPSSNRETAGTNGHVKFLSAA